MNIQTTITYGSEMERVLDNKRFYKGIQRFCTALGKDLANTMREGIAQPPKSGRIYNYRGRKHRASAPMEYPANRSGLLRRNTTFEVSGLKLEAGTKNVSYAPILQQYKTAQERTSSFKKIAPRPYITLAHDAVVRNGLTAEMISAIQAEID